MNRLPVKNNFSLMKYLCYLFILMICISCRGKNKTVWTKMDIAKYIQQKTDIALDTNFIVLKDTVIQTPNAFDLDYESLLLLKLAASSEALTVSSIKKSLYFNTLNTQPYDDSLWQLIRACP